MDVDYDVVVIGAGPGGYVAAIRAGQLGLKTAIIEREALGGVCLNWGCIPSKSLLKNAEIVSYFHRAEEFGLHFDNFHADYAVAIDRSRKVVERNVRGVEYLLKKNNVEQINGTGSLRGNGVIDVAPDGQKLNAKHIVVATGARPRSIPPLPVDQDTIITSRESIVLKELPRSIVIVGGGAIGVEFAYLYQMYGVEVTVVELLPHLVPNEDEEISRQLERAFSKLRINHMTGAGVTGVDRGPEGLKVHLSQDGVDKTIECEKRRIPPIRASTSALVLYRPNEARTVAGIPKRSIIGCAQWWPVRTLTPSWSRMVPTSCGCTSSTVKETTPL